MREIIFALGFTFLSSQASAESIFVETFTLDGKPVDYVPVLPEHMYVKRQTVAYTVYNKKGAYIYYDSELFTKLKRLSKFLIIEHERAHHLLGHTLSTKGYRERKELIPGRLTYRKEVDADCESGFRAREVYNNTITPKDLNSAMRAIYIAEGGDQKKYPEWLTRRTSKVITCFEALVERPKTLEE